MEESLVTKIAHVSFIVKNTEKSLIFYRDLLGFKTSDRPQMTFAGAWLEITPDTQIHLLELPNPDASSNRPEHGGRDRHVAFYVQDFDKLKLRLETASIPFSLSKSGRKALFCHDPDKNALEFICL